MDFLSAIAHTPESNVFLCAILFFQDVDRDRSIDFFKTFFQSACSIVNHIPTLCVVLLEYSCEAKPDFWNC